MLMEHDPTEKLDPSLIPDLKLGCRHCLHRRYVYSNDTASSSGAMFQHRFFNIGIGLRSTAEFLKKARCGHTYGGKKAKAIFDVKNDNVDPVRMGYVEEAVGKFLRRVGCLGPTTYVNGRVTVVHFVF